jgi:DNA-binding NtrC family response regulator
MLRGLRNRPVLRQIGSLDGITEVAPATQPPDTRRLRELYERMFRASPAMREVEGRLLRVVGGTEPVLVEGETGTGKDLVAEMVHVLSERASGPWERLSCGALPGDRLDAELFGEEIPGPGGRPIHFAGRVDAAAAGSLFLDEVTDLPETLQARVLELLAHGSFYRNGGRQATRANARVIASTHRNVRTLVAAGTFRADLYQRLGALTLRIPPLRERREEIPALVEHFRSELSAAAGCHRPRLSARTMEALVAYDWPGNVRELSNLVRRYVVLGDERHVRDELANRLRATERARFAPLPGEGLRSLGRRVARQAERAAIEDVLARVDGNRAEAARRLKVSYKTLLAKLKTLDRA